MSLAIQLILVNGVVCVPLRSAIEESTVSTATREFLGVARFATLIFISGLPLSMMPLPRSRDLILKETSPMREPRGPMERYTIDLGLLFILNLADSAGTA